MCEETTILWTLVRLQIGVHYKLFHSLYSDIWSRVFEKNFYTIDDAIQREYTRNTNAYIEYFSQAE